MVILVPDTSVLIDLERGGLLVLAFSNGLTLVVPDILYQEELEDNNGPYLKQLGLGVSSLSPAEVSAVQEVRSRRSALSISDCFALVLSLRKDHVLVTGDRILRNEAEAVNVEVHGLLWLLDQLEELGVQKSLLHQGLAAISSDLRCRLPKEEVSKRLSRWGKTKA